MIDEPLPTPSGIDAELESSDERPDDERPSGGQASDGDPSCGELDDGQPDAERPAHESGTGPDRATDSPPDSGQGDEVGDREPEPAGGDDDSDESEPLEYRLERLRLWRTVVTLAVVVGRLIRSF